MQKLIILILLIIYLSVSIMATPISCNSGMQTSTATTLEITEELEEDDHSEVNVLFSIKDLISDVKTDASKASTAIKNDAQKVGSAIKTGAEKVGSEIKTGAEKVGNAIKTGAEKVGNAIKTGAEKVGSAIKNEAKKIYNGINLVKTTKCVNSPVCYMNCTNIPGGQFLGCVQPVNYIFTDLNQYTTNCLGNRIMGPLSSEFDSKFEQETAGKTKSYADALNILKKLILDTERKCLSLYKLQIGSETISIDYTNLEFEAKFQYYLQPQVYSIVKDLLGSKEMEQYAVFSVSIEFWYLKNRLNMFKECQCNKLPTTITNTLKAAAIQRCTASCAQTQDNNLHFGS